MDEVQSYASYLCEKLEARLVEISTRKVCFSGEKSDYPFESIYILGQHEYVEFKINISPTNFAGNTELMEEDYLLSLSYDRSGNLRTCNENKLITFNFNDFRAISMHNLARTMTLDIDITAIMDS